MMSNSSLLLVLKEKTGKWVGLLHKDTRKERLIMEGRGVGLDFNPSIFRFPIFNVSTKST